MRSCVALAMDHVAPYPELMQMRLLALMDVIRIHRDLCDEMEAEMKERQAKLQNSMG